MNFSALVPSFIDHFFLVSDFRQLTRRNLLQVFPFFLHCCLYVCHSKCLRHWNELVNKTVISQRFLLFSNDVILMRFCVLLLAFVSCSRRHQQQAYSVLRFPILLRVSPMLFLRILQGITAGIGTSNFLRQAFIVSLNSSTYGSMKNTSTQLSGIVVLWFLDSPSLFCFLFRCIGLKFPYIWPYIDRTRSYLFPCKSAPRP